MKQSPAPDPTRSQKSTRTTRTPRFTSTFRSTRSCEFRMTIHTSWSQQWPTLCGSTPDFLPEPTISPCPTTTGISSWLPLSKYILGHWRSYTLSSTSTPENCVTILFRVSSFSSIRRSGGGWNENIHPKLDFDKLSVGKEQIKQMKVHFVDVAEPELTFSMSKPKT